MFSTDSPHDPCICLGDHHFVGQPCTHQEIAQRHVSAIVSKSTDSPNSWQVAYTVQVPTAMLVATQSQLSAAPGSSFDNDFAVATYQQLKAAGWDASQYMIAFISTL